MNGIHDMGGMQGMGELHYEEESEYGFHEPWEGRVHAMMAGLGMFGGFRLELESIPAEEYLRMSYYERWYIALSEQLINYGLVTREEIESGRPGPGSAKSTPALSPAEASDLPFRTFKSELEIEVIPRYQVGDPVRGRNMNPETHTRMPRYTRGKNGVVQRDRGVFALPDTKEYNLDPRPQHVYLIRFEARELWGEVAPAQDSLYIDMWEDYLEPV
jgi:nitrile hydratase beta subunit